MKVDLILSSIYEIFNVEAIRANIKNDINTTKTGTAYKLNPQYHKIKLTDKLLKDKANICIFPFEYLLINIDEDQIYSIDNEVNDYIYTICCETKGKAKDKETPLLHFLQYQNIIVQTTDNQYQKINKYETIMNGTKCICVKNEKTDHDSIARFNAELGIVEMCSNASVSPKLLCCEKSKNYWLEWIDGLSIHDYIKRGIELCKKLSLIKKIIRIIGFLHKHNTLYGDIHSSQFIIDENGKIWLIDYGQSFNINNSDTIKYYYGGCYFFLLPELISNNALNIISNAPIKPSLIIDVYAIGILMYYIVYEDYPFKGLLWSELYESIKNSQPTFYKKTYRGEIVPMPLIEIINKCLLKNPNDRYHSVCEFENEIYSL